MSGRAARRVTEAAKQLGEMPNVGERLDAGELSLDNLLALGSAAKQCGAAAVDQSAELLDQAAVSDAGSFGRMARRFAQAHDPTRGEGRLAHQRSARSGSFGTDYNGMRVFVGRMDDVSAALFEQAVEGHAEALWRRDGGRDGTPGQVRSNSQRTIDSVFELCTGLDAVDHKRLPRGRAKPNRPAPAQLNIIVELGLLDGTKPDGLLEVLGAGPVPVSILETLSPDTRIAAILFDRDGEALWLGRSLRRANADQRLVVAVRDRGCVACHAPMHRCDVHHIAEWDRDEGPTDIDNLAALCRRCHAWLHKTNQRLRRKIGPDGRAQWVTEPRPGGAGPGSGKGGGRGGRGARAPANNSSKGGQSGNSPSGRGGGGPSGQSGNSPSGRGGGGPSGQSGNSPSGRGGGGPSGQSGNSPSGRGGGGRLGGDRVGRGGFEPP